MIKTVLVTCSDDRFGRKEGAYYKTQLKIAEIFKNNKNFGIELRQWDWEKIKEAHFYKRNKILLDNIDPAKNGRAYKPLVIMEEFSYLDEGDFLIYNDCSPELWNMQDNFKIPEWASLRIIHELTTRNDGILTCFVKWDYRNRLINGLGIHTHDNFTLDRCMERMGALEHRYDFQHASGLIVLQKTHKTFEFLKEWVYWNCIDDCACMGRASLPGDYSYWDAEQDKKMGHRHDQSISGLLLNKIGANLIDTPAKTRYYNLNRPEIFNPYNFLRYCDISNDYQFISSNNQYNPSPDEIKKGSIVANAKGVELRVFEFAPEKGIEWIVVGINQSSCYKTTKEHLTLIKQ